MLKKILIGIFYSYWIFVLFIFLNPFLQNQRAKRAFSKEKNKLLVNWNENEEEIRKLKNMVDEISIIKEFLPSWSDTLQITIGNCTEYSERFNLDDFQSLSEFENDTLNTCILDSILVAKVKNFNKEKDCFSFKINSKVIERFGDPFDLKISMLLEMIGNSNCQGFWIDENNDLNIQFSGHNFTGSFNYLFKNESLKNDTLDINKKLGENVYWAFSQSDLWCGIPGFIEN